MEVLILLYYSKKYRILSLLIILILIFYIIYILNNKTFLNKEILIIDKGDTISKIINKNYNKEFFFNKNIFKIYYYSKLIFNKKYIHYGEFLINKNLSYIELLQVISKPSNILNKITIIEGWTKEDLNKELSKHFKNFYQIDYTDILADTYYFQKNENFEKFINRIKEFKYNYFKQFKDNEFFNNYSEKDLLIIGSLLEKEGTDYKDKKKISSVIFNRLEKNMRLQIDATVLYALTNGSYKLKRDLNLEDLKIKNPYNTYKIKGLPPNPICFVGTKTVDILMEEYKTDYLFYFYNKNLKKHIFTKNFSDHKKKLNEYRNTK